MEVDAGLQLFLALCVMFTGALIAGALPWLMNVRESQMRTVSALGGGLLIGTSLAVVIPEGFHALMAGGEDSHGHLHGHHHSHEGHLHGEEEHGEGPERFAGLALVGGFLAMLVLDHLQHAAGAVHLPAEGSSHGGGSGHGHGHGHSHGHGGSCQHAHGNGGGSGGGDGGSGGGGRGQSQGHSHAHGHRPGTGPPPEPLPPDAGAGALPHPQLPGGPLGGAGAETVFDSADFAADTERQPLVGAPPPDPPGPRKASSPRRAITGLMVHCAADGLAMGAAALSGDMRLSMMIAVAMIVHKAPMAFGLATYLMAHRWPWAKAQSTMVLFSAMAPLGAAVTYLALGPFFSSASSVALIVLFSGGTFLYAATMHILPEVLGAGCHLTLQQIAAVTAGGLLPVFLSVGHEH